MQNFDGMKFKGTDAEGNEMDCEVLHSFDCEKTCKSYIVYTDGALNDEGKLRFFASSYTMDGENLMLEPVTDDSEWEMVENEILTSERY